jgi:hypothetical protein
MDLNGPHDDERDRSVFNFDCMDTLSLLRRSSSVMSSGVFDD